MSMLDIAKKISRLNKSKLKETRQHYNCNCGRCLPKVNSLFEAKADTQRLIDFAGEDLANRFLKIKDKLKAPENDLYYWIKNKTVDELEQAVSAAEGTKSNTQMKKDIADQGAELVADTAHWRVYHITTFAASQKYGRDSHWCITGVDGYGDRYWEEYTSSSIQFYFAITKENYDPRGYDSKFAFAVYPPELDSHIEIYDQQDNRASLSDIPYYQEIKIPGVDLSNVVDPDYDNSDEEADDYCCQCGCELWAEDALEGTDGEYYCEDCWPELFFSCNWCEETGSREDAISTVFGELLCETCWNEFIDSDKGNAQAFANWSFDGIESFFGEINTENEKREVEKELHVFATCWFAAKSAGLLDLTETEMDTIEQTLFADAANLGLDFKRERYTQEHDYSGLDNPMDTGYSISVDGSSKRAENHSINVEQALEEILAFINSLSDEEKSRVRSSWRCASTGYDPDEEHFMDGYEGELIVNIYSDAEQEGGLWDSEEERIQEKTGANYEEAEDKIRAALGLPKNVYESVSSLYESYKQSTAKKNMSLFEEFKCYEHLWD